VNVAADLDGGLELEEHGLRDKQIPRAQAQHLHLRLRQVDLLPRPGAPHAQELVDDDVDGIAEERHARHADAAGGDGGGLAGRGGGVVGSPGGCVSVRCHGLEDLILVFLVEEKTSSIGHPPHSSASPVELRLRVQ